MSLHLLWFSVALGAVVAGIMQLAKVFAGRRYSTPTTPVGNAKASLAERARYWLWALCFFPLSMALGIWLGVDNSRTVREGSGVIYAVMAASWLVLGLVPYLWVARGGANDLNAFRRKVEYHSRSKFRTLVILWWIAIGVLTLAAANDLLR